ncbi:amidohydrolase [Tistrella bauzanensis]|uniref:Amidohydrolase n=1 Tax=Tistrella bauzanensis TaxID=657419 RepID=A0ABQ1IWK0_9PROT|nr:amidohydrolase family protein [Tistrella bauzanensis]GGB53006.1 amidohydrolase [Tistrella bauzanensis]
MTDPSRRQACRRLFCDADSHVMELPDFLRAHADPGFREALPRIAMDTERRQATVGEAIAQGHHGPETIADRAARGTDLLAGPKDYHALGAFDGGERGQALDLLGLHRQVVFPSFSLVPVFFGQGGLPLTYGTARALNRAMAAFCAGDARLLGVGLLPIDDAALARDELEHVIRLGLRAVWVPHQGLPGYAFRPRDLEPVWARMAEAGLVLASHIMPPLDVAMRMTGPGEVIPPEMLDGDDAPRPEEIIFASDRVQVFLSKLVFDGVLERHPDLRCVVAEFGGAWVPGMMRRLDALAERIFAGSGRAPGRRPSEQILDQCLFTPYHHEDVGALIRASDSRLYAFSTDYPHIEGGQDPVGAFDASLAGCTEAQHAAFYAGNFLRVFGE